MKWLMAFVIVLSLLCPCGAGVARADMIPPDPPENPARESHDNRLGVPAYSIAAGVVALTLTGSLIAIRTIRKRDDDLPS